MLCDRVAFLSGGNIVALDTPRNLKEQNSSKRVVVTYLYRGKRDEKTLEVTELEAGIPFLYDEILSIHSPGAHIGGYVYPVYGQKAGLKTHAGGGVSDERFLFFD